MAIPGPFSWKNAISLNPRPFTVEHMRKFTNSVTVAPTMGLAVVDIARSQPMTFAHNFDKTGFAASLVKIAPMYAAFYLQDRMKVVGSMFGTSDLDEIQDKLKKEWQPAMKAAVPRSVGDFPELGQIFMPGSFQFAAKFKSDLDKMIKNSDGEATARTVHKVGFDYMNGALTHGGFFDGKNGMWLAGDYIADSSRKDNRDGVRPPGVSTTQAASPRAIATFFVNLAQDSLISADASKAMKLIMTNTISWIDQTIEKQNPGMTLHAKIGLHGGTTHYAGIVKHGNAHYVFVALFGWEFSIENLIVEMDAMAQQTFTVGTIVDFLKSVIH